MTITLHVNIHAANGLPIHGNDVLFQHPKRVNSHPQPSGELPRGSPNGESLRGGGSPYQDPLKKPLPNPHVGFYRWLAPNPRIFMPPWHQAILIQFEQTNKLPYWKPQYPTYVKDTNLDAPIRVFKKAIRANGEIMETDIINLFGFTL
jgi:hypothetical protein